MDIRRFDGGKGTIIISAVPLRDREGEVSGYITVSQDITKLRRTEEALEQANEELEQRVLDRTRELSESESKYRLLHDTMLQGIVFQNADGTVISMNPAAERILVRSPEEFIGSSSVGQERYTIHEDGTPFPGMEHPAMVALRTGKEVRDVVMGMYDHREKMYRWIIINAVPLFHPGEDRPYQVYTTFGDITERKRMEEALKKSESGLANAQRIAHVGSWEWDIQNNTFEASAETQRIFGNGPEIRSTRQEFLDAVHPDDREFVSRTLEEAVRLNKPYNIDYRVVRSDGTQLYVHAEAEVTYSNAKPFRVVGTVQDITELKKAEKALKESEERYRELVDSSQMPSSCIVICDCSMPIPRPWSCTGRRASSIWHLTTFLPWSPQMMKRAPLTVSMRS